MSSPQDVTDVALANLGLRIGEADTANKAVFTAALDVAAAIRAERAALVPVIPPPPVTLPPPVVPPVVPVVPGSNEPAGMTVLLNEDFAIPFALPKPSGYAISQGYTRAFEVITDNTGPRSPGSIFRANFLPPLKGGSSPGILEKTFAKPVKTLYLATWLRFDPQFEINPVVQKLFHILVNGKSELFTALNGVPEKPRLGEKDPTVYIDSKMRAMIGLQGRGNLTQNALEIARGTWHRIEILLTGHPLGVPEGTAKLWQNGTLLIDKSGLTFSTLGSYALFTGIQHSATLGGVVPSPTQPFVLDCDHWYASGR